MPKFQLSRCCSSFASNSLSQEVQDEGILERKMSDRRRVNPQTMAKDMAYLKLKINEILTNDDMPVHGNDIRLINKDIDNITERYLTVQSKLDHLQSDQKRVMRNTVIINGAIFLLLAYYLFVRFF